jgi:hypothetical protein
MAGLLASHALTAGLAEYLSHAYQLRPVSGVSCKFETVGSTELRKLDGQDTKCSLYVYRTSHNEHLRNRPPASLPYGKPQPLTVNLHILITVWADSAKKEQSLIGWLMRELHQRPVLDNGIFSASGGFAADDVVQFTPDELSLDDTAKLWQLVSLPYRPSLHYVARNVKIDLEAEPDHALVAATRFTLTDDVRSVAEGA